MAYRSSTQRQLKQLAHLIAEYVGDRMTITGPAPASGLMRFDYAGRHRFGGFYVGRRGELLTGYEAGFPAPSEFGLTHITTGPLPKREA